MTKSTARLVSVFLFLATAGCTAGAPDGGPTVSVDVAALSLDGVGDVVWAVEVVNGAATPERVWAKRITSSGFGDGDGSAGYVGPCDASAGAADNTVRVWVVGLYRDDVADAGVFASGASTGITATPITFENPTRGGPLTQVVTCRPNADQAARFDVTIMRGAQQGFFDVAVDFNDVFCSAKFDCTAGNLLFDAQGIRERTFVLGFACSAGAGATVDTALYMDRLVLDCDGLANGFQAALSIDPAGGNGNLCTAGDVGACAAVSAASGVDPDTYLYQVAAYLGHQALASAAGPVDVRFWNIALGVNTAISSCRLRTRATGDDDADDDDQLVNGVVTPGAISPYVAWDVDLASCGAEALTLGAPDSPVHAAYTTRGDSLSFARAFTGAGPAGCVGAGCARSFPAGFVTPALACPSGWSNLGSVTGPPAASCGASNCVLCEAPAGGSSVPPTMTVLMPSCPASWTDEGTASGGPTAAACPSTACHLCTSPSAPSEMPSGASLLAQVCPAGWTDLATTPTGGPSAVGCSIGGNSCEICQAP